MRHALIVAAALLPAACATHDQQIQEHEHPPAVVQVEEVPQHAAPAVQEPAPMLRPDASYDRMARYGKRASTSDAAIVLPIGEAGMEYPELFRFVSEQTGIRIRYEQHNATIKSKKVYVTGPTRVAKDDLIAWMQDACMYDSLVVLPFGPSDRREYAAMDLANPHVVTFATTVHEDDLPALAGRAGMYVSSVLTLPHDVDPNRVRNALSQLSTRTAGLGRVMEMDKHAGAIMVSDFASVVANMRRMLDQLAIEQYEASLR
jgi:hypothetical protein